MGRNLLNVCVGVRVTKSQPSHSISVLPPSHTRREAIPRRPREPQVASRDRDARLRVIHPALMLILRMNPTATRWHVTCTGPLLDDPRITHAERGRASAA